VRLQSNKNIITALILFLLTLSSVTIGISDVGVVWDEPNAHFIGSEQVIEWIGKVTDRLARGDWKALFDDQLLQTYWPPSTKDSQNKIGFNDHPPIARYLPALSWYLFHDLFGDIESFRFSSAFLFALVVASLFWIIASEFSFSAGLFGSLSLILMPRVFGHAHIAATDMPMMAFWWFSILSFYKALKDSRWKYVFALFLGLAWVVKFTGLLIPVGLILYSLTAKDRRVLKIIKPVLIISPLIMWVLNPTWWKNPFQVFYENFFKLFLTREEFAQIPVYYLGKTFEFNLPWHQAFILTALTVPVSIFVLSLIGVFSNSRFLVQPKLTSLFLWQLIWYYIVMMLPFTPNHDGVRLFLPVFPFLACFSGIGFEKLCDLISVKAKLWSYQHIKSPFIKITLGITLLFPCALNLVMNHPYYYYFNPKTRNV
jgi:4-amino-4-deoxy-L-arabinose transferase-like glycosyltransferase